MRVESCTATNGQQGEKETSLKLIENRLVAPCSEVDPIYIYVYVCVCVREREMFYLTTHSTHFIYGYMASDMVKHHSDSEKGNPLPPHRLLLSINSKGSFICTIPQRG